MFITILLAVLSTDPASAATDSAYLSCVKYVANAYAPIKEKLQAAKVCQTVTDLACITYVANPYSPFADKLQAAEACASTYYPYDPRVVVESAVDLHCVSYVANPYSSAADKLAATKVCRRLELREI